MENTIIEKRQVIDLINEEIDLLPRDHESETALKALSNIRRGVEASEINAIAVKAEVTELYRNGPIQMRLAGEDSVPAILSRSRFKCGDQLVVLIAKAPEQ